MEDLIKRSDAIKAIDYALVVACSRLEDKESYEAYERWKERHRNGQN